MDIYLIPGEKKYELYCIKGAPIEDPKGFWDKVKKRFQGTNNLERVLKFAYSSKEELKLVHPESLSGEKAQETYTKIVKKARLKHRIFCGVDATLTPTTFVVAPFLPLLNWGFTAYFGVRCVSHYKAARGARKVLKSENYAPSEQLSHLERILIEEKDYAKVAEQANAYGYKNLAEFYKKKTKKKKRRNHKNLQKNIIQQTL